MKPNEDDHVDHSEWDGFFKDSVVFYNNIVLEIMIKDLMFELDKRKPFEVTEDYMTWCAENHHEADDPDTHEIYTESVNEDK